MGFIGIGNRGTKLLKSFMSHNNVRVTALCDVYEPYRERRNSDVDQTIQDEVGGAVPPMDEGLGRSVRRFNDFRKMMELQELDAVCIATPDHWHALQTLLALDAGKDVYVEKPLTITLEEGKQLVKAVEKSDRIVQVGLNRRGSPLYQRLVKMVQQDKIGKVSLARAFRVSNMYPDGIGRRKPTTPPPGFDWEMWLGPRGYQPYQSNIAPYKFRWWKEYSSQMGNWGVHYMDTIRWLMNEKAPVVIDAHGSNALVNDDRTIPDTAEVTFRFSSGAMISFGIYEASGGRLLPEGELQLQGTKGNLFCSQRGYTIEPSDPGQFQSWDALVQEEEGTHSMPSNNNLRYAPRESAALLIDNFLDCVVSRNREDLMCPIEDGHRSTSFALLANISLETHSRLEWDTERELVTNVPYANEFLHYEYREPWQSLWESLT